MNKAEKQEVLEYLRGRYRITVAAGAMLVDIVVICCTFTSPPLIRIVVFVDQASELVDMALDKYHSLSDDQREELATYIIPEVSGLLISTALVFLLCVSPPFFLPLSSLLSSLLPPPSLIPPSLSPSLSPPSLPPFLLG